MSLTLDLGADDILGELQREIRRQRHTPITKIQIECMSAEFWVGVGASHTDSDLTLIFQYIGNAFPSLRQVTMKVFELPLPVIALEALIRATRYTLQVLDMEDVVLKGSQEELESLGCAFQEHPALRKIHLDWCQPMCGTLEAVHRNLSTIPHLSQVKICGSFLPAGRLRELCSKASLKCLSLLDDDLKDEAILTMSEAFEAHDNIQELSVRLCGLHPSAGERFASVLETNQSLETLEVRIKDGDWNKYGHAFAKALQSNKTLSHLIIYIDGNDTEVAATAEQLASALSEHPSLKSVRIGLRGSQTNGESEFLAKTFADPLRSMLETNTILEDIQIDGMMDSPGLPSGIAFLLKANRSGRDKLLKNPADHKLWLETLVANSADVVFTQYLLSMNPSLCPVPTPPAAVYYV